MSVLKPFIFSCPNFLDVLLLSVTCYIRQYVSYTDSMRLIDIGVGNQKFTVWNRFKTIWDTESLALDQKWPHCKGQKRSQ